MKFVIRTTALFVIIGLTSTLPSHKRESITGNCSGSEQTTETPSPVTSSIVTTVIPSAGNCVDNNEWCGEWASYGFCKDDAHTGYMLVSCKKSCGVCGNGGDGSEPTTKTSSTVTSSPVTTVTPSAGNCNGSEHTTETPSPVTSSPVTTVTSPPVTTVTPSPGNCNGSDHTIETLSPVTSSPVTTVTSSPGNCMDDNKWCGEWASYGYCKDDAHTGYMLVSCKKSCGVCNQA